MNRLILIVCLVLCGCEQIAESKKIRFETSREVFEYIKSKDIVCKIIYSKKNKKDCRYGEYNSDGSFCNSLADRIIYYKCSNGEILIWE